MLIEKGREEDRKRGKDLITSDMRKVEVCEEDAVDRLMWKCNPKMTDLK